VSLVAGPLLVLTSDGARLDAGPVEVGVQIGS
jgi:hypothetical protein